MQRISQSYWRLKMAENSAISWTSHTFNCWHGCAKISPGCDNCYAERESQRFNGDKVLWGANAERLTLSDNYWKQPLKWNKRASEKGIRERVFCASMADVFDVNSPEGVRERLWALIKETPNLDWLILTKRIGNAKKMLPSDWGDGYPNVYLMISVVNQEEANRDIPKLLNTPAAIRGLSMEPLLGPISFRWARWVDHDEMHQLKGSVHHLDGLLNIDWVIVGGESGPNARPMNPKWARDIRDQCALAHVPFFFKQWGEWIEEKVVAGGDLGGDMRRGVVTIVKSEGENDGTFRQGDMLMRRIGKKNAGTLLDGQSHEVFPITF